MFNASQLLSLVTQPLAWVALPLLALGLVCLPRRRMLGAGLSWAALGLLVLPG